MEATCRVSQIMQSSNPNPDPDPSDYRLDAPIGLFVGCVDEGFEGSAFDVLEGSCL